MKAVVATFNQEKALVGAFSVITNLRMELFETLLLILILLGPHAGHEAEQDHHHHRDLGHGGDADSGILTRVTLRDTGCFLCHMYRAIITMD